MIRHFNQYVLWWLSMTPVLSVVLPFAVVLDLCNILSTISTSFYDHFWLCRLTCINKYMSVVIMIYMLYRICMCMWVCHFASTVLHYYTCEWCNLSHYALTPFPFPSSDELLEWRSQACWPFWLVQCDYSLINSWCFFALLWSSICSLWFWRCWNYFTFISV